MSTTVGLAQWLPACGRPAENLADALGHVRELARRGADLVVLPELWPSGYDPQTLASDATEAAEPLDGPGGRELAGVGADALEDVLHDDDAVRGMGAAAARLIERRIEALRWLQAEDKRPYCATADEWSWFDGSKSIEGMSDVQSDLDPALLAVLGGVVKSNYKVFPSGLAAMEDFVEKVAAHLAAGKPWPMTAAAPT